MNFRKFPHSLHIWTFALVHKIHIKYLNSTLSWLKVGLWKWLTLAEEVLVIFFLTHIAFYANVNWRLANGCILQWFGSWVGCVTKMNSYLVSLATPIHYSSHVCSRVQRRFLSVPHLIPWLSHWRHGLEYWCGYTVQHCSSTVCITLTQPSNALHFTKLSHQYLQLIHLAAGERTHNMLNRIRGRMC